MIFPDVNILVYAFRRDMPRHNEYRHFVEAMIEGPGAYAISDMVLSAVVRILTNRRIFREPTSLPEAIRFVHFIRERGNCVHVAPGPRHWDIFIDLCTRAGVAGNLVPDAFLAAMAIEAGCEMVSGDRDFTRFPGLRWRHPLD